MQDFSLLRDFALIMVVAGVVTILLRRFRQPPVLGYLIAGILISPYFLAFYTVNDTHTINLLADIGLVLLLFGVGLEFGWSKIRQVGLTVILIGLIEIMTMISLGYGLGRLLGWSRTDALFLGAAFHASSSAIIVKVLKDVGKLHLLSSKVIIGILLLEDFAAVVIIALLSGISSTGVTNFDNVAFLILKLVIFGASSLALGALLVPRIIAFTHKLHSRETLLIASLGLCFALALISEELGLSVASGAFLMGALVGDTAHSEEIVEVVAPVRDMFAAIFFVAIGMLIDISKFREFLLPAILVTVVYIAGKIVSNTIASSISGYDAKASLEVGMGMPQMGEFSLAVGKIGIDSGITTAPVYPIIAIATTLSTVSFPYIARSSDAVSTFFQKKSPRVLRGFFTNLNEWIRTARHSYPRQSEEAKTVRKAIRTVLINILILLVVLGIGAFGLQFTNSVAKEMDVRKDIIALIFGFIILVLCMPSIFFIWRGMRTWIEVLTRESLPGVRKAESLRIVLSNSIVIFLAVVFCLWLIPFISQLLFVGSLAITLPAMLLAIVLFLVTKSITRVHGHLEQAFSRIFLGDHEPTKDTTADQHDSDSTPLPK
jgi:monovalent cation:H+ antiporter-2, CPA2 family